MLLTSAEKSHDDMKFRHNAMINAEILSQTRIAFTIGQFLT